MGLSHPRTESRDWQEGMCLFRACFANPEQPRSIKPTKAFSGLKQIKHHSFGLRMCLWLKHPPLFLLQKSHEIDQLLKPPMKVMKRICKLFSFLLPPWKIMHTLSSSLFKYSKNISMLPLLPCFGLSKQNIVYQSCNPQIPNS